MDMRSKTKTGKSSSSFDQTTGFSDDEYDDFIDDYDDDFISGMSSDDSVKDFLKSKSSSANQKQTTPISSSLKASQPQTKFGNRFLTGLDNDHFSVSPRDRQQVLEKGLFGKEKSNDFNPLLSLLNETPPSLSEKVEKKSSFARQTTPKDSAKPKKVEFQPHQIASPRHLTEFKVEEPNSFQLRPKSTLHDVSLQPQPQFVESRENLKNFSSRADYFNAEYDKSKQYRPQSSHSLHKTKDVINETDYASKADNRGQSFERFVGSPTNSHYLSNKPKESTKDFEFLNSSTDLHYRSYEPKGSAKDYDLRSQMNSRHFADESSPYMMNKSPEDLKPYERFQSTRSIDQREFGDVSSKYVDYLLNDKQPQSEPLKQPASYLDKEKPHPKPRSSQNSPKSVSSDQSSKTKSSSLDSQPHLKSIENTEKKKETSYTDFLSSLPSLGDSRSEASLKEGKTKKGQSKKKSFAVKREKSKLHDQHVHLEEKQRENPSGVDGDDLMFLFEKATVTTKPDLPAPPEPSLHDLKKQRKSYMKPSEAVAYSITKQRQNTSLKQHSSAQQLVANVIDSVAAHNQNYAFTKQYATDEGEKTEEKSKQLKKKSIKAKPPKNYKGLGSLSSFQQLRRFSINSTDSTDLLSTTDIRSSAYMLWLADREKKLKEKKKIKREEEEKENEQKQKDGKEKLLDNQSARKAWAQKKEEELEEEEQRRKTDRRKRREERMRVEEEKWKSQKRAEVARERSLIEARKRHQINMKLKREDQLIKEQKQQDKIRANERAFEKWDEERGDQWKLEQARKLRRKGIKERGKKEYAQQKHDEAKQNFLKWQEKKKQQNHRYARTNYHEERPPWCPPNKTPSNTA